MNTEVKTIDSTDYTTGYTYDALSRVKTMTYPDGETVTYGYDFGGQVKTLTSGAGTSEEYQYLQDAQYNALGQPTHMALGGDSSPALTRDYGYYPAGSGPGLDFRLHGITTTNGSDVILHSSLYTYDQVGNAQEPHRTAWRSGNNPTSLDLTYGYETYTA